MCFKPFLKYLEYPLVTDFAYDKFTSRTIFEDINASLNRKRIVFLQTEADWKMDKKKNKQIK